VLLTWRSRYAGYRYRPVNTRNHQDWAFTIAYNAVFQAGQALLFSQGYCLDGANQHVSVVKFVELYLDKNDSIIFDRMQRKRNSSVYDTAGSLTESEAAK
jgi:uncharacterized protein (UPF0332 family)